MIGCEQRELQREVVPFFMCRDSFPVLKSRVLTLLESIPCTCGALSSFGRDLTRIHVLCCGDYPRLVLLWG